MYKAVVFFDLDGTLLNSRKRVLPSSLKAIREMKAHHTLPVIATGRNLLMVNEIMRVTGISTVISANGSYIQYQGKPLNLITIPTNMIQKLINISSRLNQPLAFQTANQIVLNARTKLTKQAYKDHSVNPQVMPNFYRRHHINFINLFTTDCDQFYQHKFAHQLKIVRNSTKCLDVTRTDVNKQSGIKILLKKLKLLKCPTYAFGDGLNDIEMFKEVNYPIAMANGCLQCRQCARFVTSSNDRDGIYRGLKHFRVI